VSLLLILLLLIIISISEGVEHEGLLLLDAVLALSEGAAATVDELSIAVGIGVSDATVTLLGLKSIASRLVLLGRLVRRGLADLLVDLEVHVLHGIGIDTSLNVLLELLSVLFWLLLLHGVHVLGDVASEDALTVVVSGILLGIRVVTVELLLVVRDLETTIEGTLHGSKDLGAKGSALEADIEKCVECLRAILLIILVVHEAVLELGGHLFGSDEFLIETVLGEQTASAQETHAVCGRVVGETNTQAVARELMSIGSGVADIVIDLGGNHLADNVLVGETNNETVLWGTELVLGLSDEALASTDSSLNILGDAL